MAFTRAELFEHFGQDGYAQVQVTQALEKLAEIDKQLDPKAQQFDESIIEQMEDIFAIIQDAIASSKQLTGASDLAQIEQTAINLATERSLAIPIDSLKSLIEILDAEAAVEAVTLYQRRKAIREGILTQLEANALAEANEQAAKRMDALNKLCSNPKVLDQILTDYGLLSVEDASKQHVEITASSSIDFDENAVDAFLSEVNGKKKSLPRTIPDTKRLAKLLVTRSLK